MAARWTPVNQNIMSSGFVSAGGEELKPREGLSGYDNDAWTKARQKIEELKKPKEAPGTQEGGKSLYEHLQAQKAAKQEAFEEATKLRNQFRPLDDSEVAFLDSIKLKEKAEATTVRKETQVQLAAFRREREAAEEKVRELEASHQADRDNEEAPKEKWTATKKRRRAKDDDKIATSKALKTSTSTDEVPSTTQPSNTTQPPVDEVTKKSSSPISDPAAVHEGASPRTTSKPATTLVAYDSDSDD